MYSQISAKKNFRLNEPFNMELRFALLADFAYADSSGKLTIVGIFDFVWSDDEAQAERASNGWTNLDCDVVCDDCYKAMGFI